MRRRIALVTITLISSFGLRVLLNGAPSVPNRETLANFPKQAGSWTMIKEDVLSDSDSAILKADDYVLRSYSGEKGQHVDLFIAYFKVENAGEAMHSPRNCLPGAGWEIVKMDRVALWPDTPANPTMINQFVIAKNGEKAMVLYWYQAIGRVIASEYWGKFYLVMDALRTGRRDGAIVRFVSGMSKDSDGKVEAQAALQMARTMAPLLPKYLPD